MSLRTLATRFAVVALALAGSSAFAQTMLTPDQTHRFTLPARSLTNDLAIDIPASARQLRITADGPANGDIDLLLRYGGSFPALPLDSENNPVPNSYLWVAEHAHYVSQSPGSTEHLTVTRNQKQPLRQGRWYISIMNFSGNAAQIDLRATLSNDEPGPVNIETVFDDTAGCAARNGAITTPWFDNTVATPIQGNSGTTLGQQRRNAFLHAVSQTRQELDGVADLRILACWKALGGNAFSAPLASAGPTYIIRDDGSWSVNNSNPVTGMWLTPFLDSRYTWYSSAGAAQRAGTEFCRYASDDCSSADIFIQFNSDVDGSTALGTRKFHYGYDAPVPGDVDFVSTAMHEITHGLGFVSMYQLDAQGSTPVGGKLFGYDDVYSDNVVAIRNNVPVPVNTLPAADLQTALTSLLDLRWSDPEAVSSPLNPWRERPFPGNLPALYAPRQLSPVATLSHVSDLMPITLMQPFDNGYLRTLGLATPILAAVGWKNSANTEIPASPRPYGGQWFDPARNGHGLDLHHVPGTADTYVLVLYTYDAAGIPEWFTATGRIVDGIFRPAPDHNGNSLQRVFYTDINSVPMRREADPSVPGEVRIDFSADAAKSAACQDGTGRNGPLALMAFSLGSDHNLRWCLSQITSRDNRPGNDLTGHRFDAGDAGWGLTTMGFNTSEGDGLFSILYFPDSQGQPRWAAAQVNDFQAGAEQPVYQIQGYCRTCPKPASNPATQIGTLTLRLADPASADGGADFDVQFNGPGGGRFTRSGAVLKLLADSGDGGE